MLFPRLRHNIVNRGRVFPALVWVFFRLWEYMGMMAKKENSMRIAALEAGGTKMVCAIGNERGEILEQASFPTLTPEQTIPQIREFFSGKDIEALGIGCFGPVDVDKQSPTFGHITTTPKKGWANFDMVGAFRDLGVPIGFDTDVNGSVLGEWKWGAGRGLRHLIYITIGTGVGAGIISGGKPFHGLTHAEGGHVIMERHPEDHYPGYCIFHGNCFEGMCCGPALEARWGQKAQFLADKPEVWEIEAFYIAQALVDYVVLFAPERIILGGGVMHQQQLLPLIREAFAKRFNNYLQLAPYKDLDNFIVGQSLDDKQGILGAFVLGMEAAEGK